MSNNNENEKHSAILAFTGLDSTKLTAVKVERMPAVISGHAIKSKACAPQQCYKNAAMFVLSWSGDDVRFCLGVADLGIYAGHAWVEVDGKHYDPTLEIVTNKLAPEYYRAVTFTRDELWAWFEDDMNKNIPPCIDDIPEHFFQFRLDDDLSYISRRLREASEQPRTA